jgi:hypothetical protein
MPFVVATVPVLFVVDILYVFVIVSRTAPSQPPSTDHAVHTVHTVHTVWPQLTSVVLVLLVHDTAQH